jgi:hypothetical protein
MRVGTMFLGRVEALGGESIQTKFFVLGVPLVPLASYYATEERVNGVTGIEIPVHGTSVVAGYLRLVSGIAAVLCGLFAWLEHRSYKPQYGLMALAAVSFVVWALAMFVLGRLSARERMRRLLLRAVTGLGAPPELLPAHVRATVGERITAAWAEAGAGADWRERLRTSAATDDELPLLYALAEYSGDGELVTLASRQIRGPGAALPACG